MTKLDKLIAELSSQAKPVKPMPHPFISALKFLVVSMIYLALLSACFGIRNDIGFKLMTPLFLAEVGLLICMIMASGLSIALLSFPDLYQKPWAVFAPFLPLVLFCGVLIVEFLEDTPSAPRPEHGWYCLLCILSYSALPACWIFYHLRKMASTHGVLAGSVALLSASSIGCLTMRLAEKTDSISHLLEWHYIPMLVISIIGLGLGWLFLKW